MGNTLSEDINKLRKEINGVKNEVREQNAELNLARNLIETQTDELVPKLREEVKIFQPSTPKKINIALIGHAGTGKTSLLNSLKFAVEGKLERSNLYQSAPEGRHGSHTLRRKKAQITPHITFIDNRGVTTMEGDLFKEVLLEQLEGRGSFTQIVEWDTPFNRPTVEEDKIYCTVIIVSGQSPDTTLLVNPLTKFLREWQGQYPVAVITHKDVAKPEQLGKVKALLEGLGISSIFTVSNIQPEKYRYSLSFQDQEQLLRLIQKCIQDASDIYKFRQEVANEAAQD